MQSFRYNEYLLYPQIQTGSQSQCATATIDVSCLQVKETQYSPYSHAPDKKTPAVRATGFGEDKTRHLTQKRQVSKYTFSLRQPERLERTNDRLNAWRAEKHQCLLDNSQHVTQPVHSLRYTEACTSACITHFSPQPLITPLSFFSLSLGGCKPSASRKRAPRRTAACNPFPGRPLRQRDACTHTRTTTKVSSFARGRCVPHPSRRRQAGAGQERCANDDEHMRQRLARQTTLRSSPSA